MLKVIIVDDEPKVREGLKTIIKWEDYGYRICGECADGFEGLDMISRLKPDLVLVDIKMPGMDGLEFIDRAKQVDCSLKFLILSGYSDFAYAREAIRLNVCSYLLKPVEEDELIQNIVEIKSKISSEKEAKHYISTGKTYIRESAIKAALKGGRDYPAPAAQDESGLFSLSGKHQVLLIEAKGKVPQCGDDALIKGINGCFCGNCPDEIHVFEIDGRICIVLSEGEISRKDRLVARISSFLSGACGGVFLMALGRTTDNFMDISRSYMDAVKLMEMKFYFKSSGVLDWEELKNDPVISEPVSIKECSPVDAAHYAEKLFVALEIMNENRAGEIISGLFAELKLKRYPEPMFKGFCASLMDAVSGRIVEKYPSLALVVPQGSTYAVNIYGMADIRQLSGYIAATIREMAGCISAAAADSRNIIKKVINYINENYHTDLTLDMLGKLFGYNSCYLGKVIKQYTGRHFNTYLENIRIERAKKLLLQGCKVSDAARRTGFKDPDYFCFKFKKNVGISALEYKKTYMSNF